jgi:MFS family permease
MSVPPYCVAAVTTVVAGYASDRLQKRGIVAIGFSALGALGFLMLLVTPNPNVQYAGLFLAAAGVYPLIPIVVSWGSNNCGGSLKKGVATAIIVSFGNAGKSSSGQYQMMTSGTDRNTGSLGGVISSFIYPREDRPRYIKGHAICFAYCLIVVVSSAIMIMYLNAQNKKKAARIAERDHPWTAEEKLPYEDDGDNVEWFKYAI